MQFGSYFASILLHALLVLMALLWPSKPPVDLTRTVYQVSLVEGAPGGEMLPSPVLGKQGDPGAKARAEARSAPDAMPQNQPAPTAPAPAAPAPADIKTPEAPLKAPDVPRPESVPKPVPQPPKADAEPVSPTKVEQPKPKPKVEDEPKPEPPKPAPEPPKPVPEPPKPAPKAEDAPPKAPEAPKVSPEDALKAALADAQKQAGKERQERPGQGQAPQRSGQAALSNALADMKRQSSRRGTGGGGGGEGDGPGGGGINDVYVGLVIMAVQPQWSTTTFSSRQNLAVVVAIRLDADGNILDCRVDRSSGNAAFDGSAINAVRRTRVLPKPPTPEQQDLLITFNSQDMVAR